MYSIVSGITGGPSVGDIVVSITSALIQLVAILIMNKLYERFAYKLTNWGECWHSCSFSLFVNRVVFVPSQTGTYYNFQSSTAPRPNMMTASSARCTCSSLSTSTPPSSTLLSSKESKSMHAGHAHIYSINDVANLLSVHTLIMHRFLSLLLEGVTAHLFYSQHVHLPLAGLIV